MQLRHIFVIPDTRNLSRSCMTQLPFLYIVLSSPSCSIRSCSHLPALHDNFIILDSTLTTFSTLLLPTLSARHISCPASFFSTTCLLPSSILPARAHHPANRFQNLPSDESQSKGVRKKTTEHPLNLDSNSFLPHT